MAKSQPRFGEIEVGWNGEREQRCIGEWELRRMGETK